MSGSISAEERSAAHGPAGGETAACRPVRGSGADARRPSGYLFDLDGTLLNTLTDIALSCNAALCEAGFPEHTEEAYKRFVGNGVALLIRRALPEGASAASHRAVMERYNTVYSAHSADHTSPYAGISALLRSLQARGAAIAVLSNKPDADTKALIASYFPDIRFASVLGARPGVPTKPDPTAVRETLQTLSLPAGDCIFIGDSDIDVQTGKNAGLYTVGCVWGFRGARELRAAGADAVVARPEEIGEVLL